MLALPFLVLLGWLPSAQADPCPPQTGVLVERSWADGAGLSTGDTLHVSRSPEDRGCPAVVEGMFEPPADPSRLTVERPRLLFHLPHLARLTGRRDEVDRFSVLLEPGVPAAEVTDDLGSLLPGARVLDSGTVARESSTTFRVVSRFHRAIAVITLVAGGVFLACIMILKVHERRTAVAALRLVGISRRTLLGWIAAEATVVSVAGSALGVGIGYAASAIVNRHYGAAYDTSLRFSLVTPEIVGQALALSLVLGGLAGLGAGLGLLARDPLAETWR